LSDQILHRIGKELGVNNLVETLADALSGADLHSVLLAVLKRRIARLAPNELVMSGTVTKTCGLDARLLNTIEGAAYEVATQFEALELSPVTPLGSVAVLAGLDQSNVLSALRSFECASDPTVGLALECAQRRKNPQARSGTVRLCTNQRVLRFPLPTNPAYTAHFKLFSMVSAGRDVGAFAFEIAALREHIGFYLQFLSKLSTIGFAFKDISVEIADTRVIARLCDHFKIDRDAIKANVRARDSASSDKLLAEYSAKWPKSPNKPSTDLADCTVPKPLLIQMDSLQESVVAPLKEAHPAVNFSFNMHRLTGLSYYTGPCFHIKLKNMQDETSMLADGGCVNWTQQLLSDSKERLMTSAIGTELLCRMFRQ
jgi:hypothetical protein